jgi:hypothetical protein
MTDTSSDCCLSVCFSSVLLPTGFERDGGGREESKREDILEGKVAGY